MMEIFEDGHRRREVELAGGYRCWLTSIEHNHWMRHCRASDEWKASQRLSRDILPLKARAEAGTATEQEMAQLGEKLLQYDDLQIQLFEMASAWFKPQYDARCDAYEAEHKEAKG